MTINKIKLSFFKEYQIKALISYYFFNEELKHNIKSSEEIHKNNILYSECYLLDENWMNKYKELFLYDEMIQQIDNILKQSKEIKKETNRIDKIYSLLDGKFIYKIKAKYKNENEKD